MTELDLDCGATIPGWHGGYDWTDDPEPNIDWLEGDGTAEAPYQIDTADQLILWVGPALLWDRHLVLVCDIDLDPNLRTFPSSCNTDPTVHRRL